VSAAGSASEDAARAASASAGGDGGAGAGGEQPVAARDGATRLLQLLAEPARWTHRRVERVVFLDDRTVRRRVSVDFEVPAELEGVPVPLALLRKRPLVEFDLRDEGGRALPMLTRRQNGGLAAEVLLAAAEGVGGALAPELAGDLRRLATAAVEEAEGVLEDLRRGSRGEAGAALLDDPAFESLAFELARGFLLLVDVPAGGGRRILKFGYAEPLAWRTTLPQRMSWRAAGVEIDVPAVARAGSYHLEVQAPEGLEIAWASLLAFGGGGGFEEHVVEEEGLARVHLYLSDVPYGADGVAGVWLRTPARGFLRQAWLSGAATTASLLLLTLLAPRLTAANAGAAGGILLAAPGFLSLFVARPGEHRMLSRLLLGVRAVLLTQAAASYLGALVLVAFSGGPGAQRWLGGLLAASATLTVSLTASLTSPKRP
jgi:hypothetical protein